MAVCAALGDDTRRTVRPPTPPLGSRVCFETPHILTEPGRRPSITERITRPTAESRSDCCIDCLPARGKQTSARPCPPCAHGLTDGGSSPVTQLVEASTRPSKPWRQRARRGLSKIVAGPPSRNFCHWTGERCALIRCFGHCDSARCNSRSIWTMLTSLKLRTAANCASVLERQSLSVAQFVTSSRSLLPFATQTATKGRGGSPPRHCSHSFVNPLDVNDALLLSGLRFGVCVVFVSIDAASPQTRDARGRARAARLYSAHALCRTARWHDVSSLWLLCCHTNHGARARL